MTARRIGFLVFALAPDDWCCWYRGIDGGYSMVTLPQIRQTDSGPDRERQTAECKDPYQEAVKFSGGFMGRGWGRYWRGGGDGIDQIAVMRPRSRYRVMSGLMCGDEAPGTRTRDKWVTGWPHPLLHPPITAPGAMIAGLQVDGAGEGTRLYSHKIQSKSHPRHHYDRFLVIVVFWCATKPGFILCSDPKIAICIQLTWRLLPCCWPGSLIIIMG